MAAIIAQISLAARERKVGFPIYFLLRKNIAVKISLHSWDFARQKHFIVSCSVNWICDELQRKALEEPPVDINRSVYKLPPSVPFSQKLASYDLDWSSLEKSVELFEQVWPALWSADAQCLPEEESSCWGENWDWVHPWEGARQLYQVFKPPSFKFSSVRLTFCSALLMKVSCRHFRNKRKCRHYMPFSWKLCLIETFIIGQYIHKWSILKRFI